MLEEKEAASSSKKPFTNLFDRSRYLNPAEKPDEHNASPNNDLKKEDDNRLKDQQALSLAIEAIRFGNDEYYELFCYLVGDPRLYVEEVISDSVELKIIKKELSEKINKLILDSGSYYAFTFCKRVCEKIFKEFISRVEEYKKYPITSINLARGLTDSLLEKKSLLRVPAASAFGKTRHKDSSFFDSIAQVLNRIGFQHPKHQVGHWSEKDLRMLCYEYYQSNKEELDKENKLYAETHQQKIPDYSRIKMTADEASYLVAGSPLAGRVEIEGYIICKLLSIRLHVIIAHTERKTAQEPPDFSATHQLVDGRATHTLKDEKDAAAIPYDDFSGSASGLINPSAQGNNCGPFALMIGIKKAIEKEPALKAKLHHSEILDDIKDINILNYETPDSLERQQIGERLRRILSREVEKNESAKRKRSAVTLCNDFLLSNKKFIDYSNEMASKPTHLSWVDMKPFFDANENFFSSIENHWIKVREQIEFSQYKGTDFEQTLNGEELKQEDIANFTARLIAILKGSDLKNECRELVSELVPNPLELDQVIRGYRIFNASWEAVGKDISPKAREKGKKILSDSLEKALRTSLFSELHDAKLLIFGGLLRLIPFDESGKIADSKQPERLLTIDKQRIIDEIRSLYSAHLLKDSWERLFKKYCATLEGTVYLGIEELDELANYFNVSLQVQFTNGRQPFNSRRESPESCLKITISNPDEYHWHAVVGDQKEQSLSQPPMIHLVSEEGRFVPVFLGSFSENSPQVRGNLFEWNARILEILLQMKEEIFRAMIQEESKKLNATIRYGNDVSREDFVNRIKDLMEESFKEAKWPRNLEELRKHPLYIQDEGDFVTRWIGYVQAEEAIFKKILPEVEAQQNTLIEEIKTIRERVEEMFLDKILATSVSGLKNPGIPTTWIGRNNDLNKEKLRELYNSVPVSYKDVLTDDDFALMASQSGNQKICDFLTACYKVNLRIQNKKHLMAINYLNSRNEQDKTGAKQLVNERDAVGLLLWELELTLRKHHRDWAGEHDRFLASLASLNFFRRFGLEFYIKFVGQGGDFSSLVETSEMKGTEIAGFLCIIINAQKGEVKNFSNKIEVLIQSSVVAKESAKELRRILKVINTDPRYEALRYTALTTDQAKKLSLEVLHLQGENSNLRLKVGNNDQDLEKIKKERDTLKKENAELRGENAGLRGMNAELRRDRAADQEQKLRLEKEKKGLHHKLDELIRKIKDLEKDVPLDQEKSEAKGDSSSFFKRKS